MTWEYKTVVLPIFGIMHPNVDPTEVDVALTKLGRDGWELVSTFDTNWSSGSSFQLVAISRGRRSPRGRELITSRSIFPSEIQLMRICLLLTTMSWISDPRTE